MEIKIETKFSPNDVAIGYYNGHFYKFRVNVIEVNFNSSYTFNHIRYHCTAIVPEDSDLTFCQDFEEHELMTKEELKEKVEGIINGEKIDDEVLNMCQLLNTKLVDMDLSVRALNCLKSADIETLGDLVMYDKTDLLKFRNFGKKTFTELDDMLDTLNLSFGMDISKYKKLIKH